MIIQKFINEKFDINKLIDLCKASIEYCCSKDYEKGQINYWKENLIPDMFKSIEQNPQNYLGFVATENSQITGTCFLDLKNNKIKGLYVKPEFLGKKIGKQIMLKTEEEASKLGIKELELDASLNAIGFYKSIGYMEIQSTSCSVTSCTVPEVPGMKMKKLFKANI